MDLVVSHPPIPAGEYVPTADQRIVMHRVSWAQYEHQLELRGEASSPRIAYFEGTLELMSPSRDHERIKSTIGCLILTYALERGIELSPYGSWTLKNEVKESGVEPDECYLVGTDQSGETPHLAIEVIWTSGGIGKLDIYARLGVGEVWFWRNGRIEVHLLREDRYHPATRSTVFPELDLDLLTFFIDQPTATQAVRAFRDALRG
jgi:Uma2 family endonuclease